MWVNSGVSARIFYTLTAVSILVYVKLILFTINTAEGFNLYGDFIAIPLKTGPKPKIMFYKLPYITLEHNIYKLDPSVLNNSLATTDRSTEVAEVVQRYAGMSNCYIAYFENMLYAGESAFLHNKAIRTATFDSAVYEAKTTVGTIDTAIQYRQNFLMWGHNIHDFLCATMFVPREVLRKGAYAFAPLHYYQNTQRLIDFLHLNITLIKFESGEQYFVRKLYVVANHAFAHGYTVYGIYKMRELVFERFNNTKDKATRFVVFNRPKGESRRIHNEEELLAALKANTTIDPGKEWELIDKPYGDWDYTCKLWMTFKVIVSPSGSMLYNSIFMPNKTGMCVMFTRQLDRPNLQLAIGSNIYLIGVTHLNMEHHFSEPIPCDVERMVWCTQRIVDAVKSEGNIDRTNLKPGFDIDAYISESRNPREFGEF
ncbi:hypothetical protein TVAG_348170 [Trichomonas vaginalis G3]|uniref:Glycosyltransferase 61 catalytic domain-containing protein n=1 Tax=Trichomonas vaginalis (strain ATCC PRA-98 / G3) TaxID=412133 RepID=A2DSV8_TRIV3|nr:glycosyltransferase family [Trichomonas vaginalis G3]EAY16507.1 hypothetical protein TVAG_348170 [Trichomonas vaginalis G3]KAI5488032.1 glycosyltransferase family [Trichomonas vaginalis G3]|eukprot:XP_001328730.1 hypothetical protein [Trichomonas vaginalis G3]